MKIYLKNVFVFSFIFTLFFSPIFIKAQQEDIDNEITSSCIDLKNNLRYRDRDINKNGEVSTLQDFLQSKGYLNSEPTGYFGLLTKQAVIKFQKEYNISPAVGYLGSISRTKIKLLTCDVNTITDISIPGDNVLVFPNGGEAFFEGQKIEVKWDKNKIPDKQVYISLVFTVPGIGIPTDQELYESLEDKSKYVEYSKIDNDGSEFVNLPQLHEIGSSGLSMRAGNFYKIAIHKVGSASQTKFDFDRSTNYFSINKNTCKPEDTLSYPNCINKKPIIDFSVSPTTIKSGENVTLKWSTQKAKTCYASADINGWDGNKPTSGSVLIQNIKPFINSGNSSEVEFMLACDNSEGTSYSFKKIKINNTENANLYPLGCTSNLGYSSITGLSCSGITCPSGTTGTYPNCVHGDSLNACGNKVNSSPSIKLISPNGGEVLNVGKEMLVKWVVCNPPSNTNTMVIATFRREVNGVSRGATLIPQTQIFGSSSTPTADDGEETFIIPSTAIQPGLIPDNNYKLYISLLTGNNVANLTTIAQDSSDNYLSIVATCPTGTTGTYPNCTNAYDSAYIKSYMSSFRLVAELYNQEYGNYGTQENDFKGSCTNPVLGSLFNPINKESQISKDLIKNLDNIIKSSNYNVNCYGGYAGAYAIYAKLPNNEGFYCVDRNLYSGVVSTNRETNFCI